MTPKGLNRFEKASPSGNAIHIHSEGIWAPIAETHPVEWLFQKASIP